MFYSIVKRTKVLKSVKRLSATLSDIISLPWIGVFKELEEVIRAVTLWLGSWKAFKSNDTGTYRMVLGGGPGERSPLVEKSEV